MGDNTQKSKIDLNWQHLRAILQHMCDKAIYAHTSSTPEDSWEPLYGVNGHAEKVMSEIERMSPLLVPEVWSSSEQHKWLRLLALWHDMGKASKEFQQYLRASAAGKRCDRVDHKLVAAKWVCSGLDLKLFGKILAYALAGHHGGLPSGIDLFGYKLPCKKLDEEVLATLPPEGKNVACLEWPNAGYGVDREHIEAGVTYSLHLLTRMLHSCLIDADWLATESFTEPEQREARRAVAEQPLAPLSARLEAYIHSKEGKHDRINELRRKIHHACYASAAKSPGVYQLNVPTGGGKTLASLSFALKHAEIHAKKRVIYVIPFTSIIEQTTAVFREALGEEFSECIVEHHSNISEESDTQKNRLATENWDAPIIVTTSVQFFETLFSATNKRCRKLHNIAQSVIIFDEAQSLPADLLKPCLAAMKTLQHQYGCTLVLCTATQPALTNRDGFDIGWDENEMQSLIGKELEHRLHAEMKRVEVENMGELTQEQLLKHFAAQEAESALFIVNFTRQAQALYAALSAHGEEQVFHLSARMCPAHRSETLRAVRLRLQEGLPTILVATRVVEAGVDISFPLVYRDCCGLDSLAQSAGRCNRHGEAAMGKAFYYRSQEFKKLNALPDLARGVHVMDDMFATGIQPNEVFGDFCIERYFRNYYERCKNDTKGGWDSPKVMEKIGTQMKQCATWDFPEIEGRFRLIKEEQKTLLVPYAEEGEELRRTLLALSHAGVMPTRAIFRRLQQLSVSLYAADWNAMPKECIHKDAGIYMLTDSTLYDSKIGLRRAGESSTEYVF